ncbi:MAG: hypothetical protein KAU07_01235 [Candidatus Andersenbacteria bacterium]|nr:hypothetical protein [Candidatus Andersenbacteria bacterium]
MIRKNSFWINSIVGILLIAFIIYLYYNTSEDFIYVLLIPLVLILHQLGIFRTDMIITKKETIKIILLIYTFFILFIFARNPCYSGQSLYLILEYLVRLYFYPLIIIIPSIIIFGFIPISILKYKDKKTSSLEKLYDPAQAALFISQRINNDLSKKIIEDDILEMIIIKYNLSGESAKYINKCGFKAIISNDEVIRLIKERFNNKFNKHEITEIFEIEKLYIKELGF